MIKILFLNNICRQCYINIIQMDLPTGVLGAKAFVLLLHFQSTVEGTPLNILLRDPYIIIASGN